jgi:hypothetical protein
MISPAESSGSDQPLFERLSGRVGLRACLAQQSRAGKTGDAKQQARIGSGAQPTLLLGRF